MSHDSPDEAAALAAAVSGDTSALGRIVALTQRDVWRYIALHAEPGDADDLTQETYLRAISTFSTFEGRSNIRTWLLTIARRVIIDQFRRRSTRPQTVFTDNWRELADAAQPMPGSFTEQVELDELLSSLSADRREALVLTQVLGLSYAEAGEVCRCPIGTIRSRVTRAREDLRYMVAEETGRGRAIFTQRVGELSP